MTRGIGLVFNLFKLRIGIVIAVTALAGIAISPGSVPSLVQICVLALAVLVSSASAGAFNQYYEHELDGRMNRTRSRPFVPMHSPSAPPRSGCSSCCARSRPGAPP